MNRPLGQALQILFLGLVIVSGSVALFWSWTRGEDSATREPLTGLTGKALEDAIQASQGQSTQSLIVIVCLAGAVGGVANNFRRLQKLRMEDWTKLDSTSRWLMTMQIYVSPFIGALFAFVLYGAFASNIIQGALFPEFDLKEKFVSLVDFAKHSTPVSNADAGKALFWAFVAGFAEGFVPNFIDKLAKDAEDGSPSAETS